eukprot:294001-Rhodomonas_salina.1
MCTWFDVEVAAEDERRVLRGQLPPARWFSTAPRITLDIADASSAPYVAQHAGRLMLAYARSVTHLASHTLPQYLSTALRIART